MNNLTPNYSNLIPLGKLKRLLFIALLVVFACEAKEDTPLIVDENSDGYDDGDIQFLQKLIDNSSETINMDMDDNGNGLIEPLELGYQEWVSGRLWTLCSNNDENDYCPTDYELSGNIPDNIGNLTSLRNLLLRFNNLSGIIPESIYNLSNLIMWTMNWNDLSGEFPSEIGNLENLYGLELGGNQLTGEIPPEIGNLTNLTILQLSYNQLSGEIPPEIGNLTNLFSMSVDLSYNQLTGEIPSEICNIGYTSPLLSNNQLCPPYPECLTEEDVEYQDTSNCESEYDLGDINCDGDLNVLDVVLMVNMILEDEYNSIADLNEDGVVNILDVVTIVNLVLSGDDNTCMDIDGNVYETIQIGDQLWMAENLKVNHYNDGSEIPTGYSNSEWGWLDMGAYAVYDDDPSNADVYGNLYNWFAVDDDRGLCMDGWHVPSDEEFMELEMYLGMSESEANSMGWRGTNEGSKLAGNSDLWNSGDLENDSEFGMSGFSAFPAGYRSSNSGTYYSMGSLGYFWSSSEANSNTAWRRLLYYNYSNVFRYTDSKQLGFSIRCLKD